MIKKKIIYRSDKIPYLVRYSIFSCPWFAIKIHNILSSDDDCLHSHPWAFWSFILKGGYYEHTPTTNDNSYKNTTSHWHGQFSFLRRKINAVHRIQLPEGKTTWTFVITFKKKQKWGFFTKNGWVEWFKHSYNEGCD